VARAFGALRRAKSRKTSFAWRNEDVREGWPSVTAMLVAAARGAAGVDPFAERLLPAGLARALVLASTGLVAHLRVRTRAIDDAVRESAASQIVLLGAGLDTRAWRLDAVRDRMVFEVDHPATQAFKRRRLGGEPALAREVVFVENDFERDDLEERLASAGHDAALATTWVWEGVTPYLTPDAIETTLAILSRRSARTSTLAMTYVTPDLGDRLRVIRPLVRPSFRVLGEPLRGLMTVDAAEATVRRHGFAPVRDDSMVDLAGRLAVPKPWLAVAERLLVATA
jgi:methyltransferase (TIGR00027 family)